MGKTRGHEANMKPVSSRRIWGRMKAIVRPPARPAASATAPGNTKTTSSDQAATNSALLNSPPAAVDTVDELPQPSTATGSSKPKLDDGDPAPSSSTVLAADTGDKPPSGCLSNSPGGSSLWEKAYNAATPNTKKWIDGLLKSNVTWMSAKSTQTEELIEVVREIETRHQGHALRIPVGGKQILWKDYAPRVISFIKVIGSITIQLAPAPSDIIWSALKTVLQMSVAPGEELAAVLGCSEKVLSIVRRGKVYEALYLNGANTFVPVQDDLERSLVDVYTKSLDLLAHVGQRLAGGHRHLLLAIVNPGEAEGLMASLIKCENDVITAAQACEVVRSADADERLSTMLNSLSEPLRQTNDRIRDFLEEEVKENDIIKALKSLSPINFGDQHRIRAEPRTPGTGEWLLQHKKFQEWEHIPASTILWLQGTMGMGKSFLASKVVDRFLLKTEQLLESVNLYPQTVIILDGLDECIAESKDKLITLLANLVKDAQHSVKIFISSRREQDIVKLLPAGSIIEIDANDNRDDIQKFIEEKMEEIEMRGSWESISKELKSDIKSTLCKGSDGMFRWASVQLEQLSECQQAKEIRDRLGKLPMSLNASYHELFTGMSSHSQETLRRTVMWVMCAYEPLSSSRLLAAVRLSMHGDGESHDVEEELTEETLRSICRHLVVIDSKRDVWKFPHASVIEYFETTHKWTMAKAHSFVAKHSLLCLIDSYSKWQLPSRFERIDGVSTTDHKRDPQHPVSYFQEYVGVYWFQHVHSLEDVQPHDPQLSRLVKRFMGLNSSLQQSSQQYRRWLEHRQNVHATGLVRKTTNFSDLFPLTNPIFGACAFGLCRVLQDWWSAGVDVSQINGEGLDLLAIAAGRGHRHLCEKLIGLGADVNRVLCNGETSALNEATTLAGNLDVIRFLLDNDADPNLPLETPILYRSAAYCGLAISEALLEAGANPDVHSRLGSPLEIAGERSDYELAELLIQYKATVNFYTADGVLGSPLAAAAHGGSIELVQLLIKHGAEVNAPLTHGIYRSALAAACFGNGGVGMVQYLIEEAGADPNIISTNPPSIPPRIYYADAAYESGRYLKENGHVVDEDVLRKAGMGR
ncbi:uncharacterized protein Triagg1_9790 [Trichoderma aggressivum f. europaeum]|uniref:Nephrocystin 3-like N-terminal domain-containing protein n=1 Tax=Trichoderma aggressivum f. europaeum TaxID=173218 RepID=A0AAE1I640_9HYPO|nr:hypothetical protein Triagg1_9790 [Trichoderma aggressivum f. europaeum]